MEVIITALRLWYYNPTVHVPLELTVNLPKVKVAIGENPSSNSKPQNFPTCLCASCGYMGIDLEVGYSEPIRYSCGSCYDEHTLEEAAYISKMKELNVYTFTKLAFLLRYFPIDFYEGRYLEAYKRMNGVEDE